jgi:hypothetical protein
MPKKYYDEYNHCKKMCCFEKLVAKISTKRYQYTHNDMCSVVSFIPDYTVRGKGEPSLEKKGNDAGPVEQGAHHCHLHDHVVPPDMVYDEGEGVHERKKEKGVCCPSVEDLNLLMRGSRDESDPVRLASGGAAGHKYEKHRGLQL